MDNYNTSLTALGIVSNGSNPGVRLASNFNLQDTSLIYI